MFWKSRRSPADFNEEIEAHLRLEADRLVEEGMTPEEAEAAARRAFGNVTGSRERFYDSRPWTWLEPFAADVHYALRQLAARPGFASIAALTLATGIAASTAIFSVVYGVLLAPLPYQDPDRLAQIVLVASDDGGVNEYLTGMDYLDFQGIAALETVACSYNYRETGFNLETPGGVRRVRFLRISSTFFDVYGVRPILGRVFRLEEERADVRRAIISHGLWQNQFAGDLDVVGKVMRADGEGYEIVGVMPPGFRDAFLGEVDVWIPNNTAPGGSNNRGNFYLTVVAKVARGVSFERAQSELDAMRARLIEEEAWLARSLPRIEPLADRIAGESPRLLYVLLAASGLLLLISCVNLATMLMASASRRERELATRAALGSSRGRLVRQLLTENLTLAVFGGFAGMVLGMAAVRGLVSIAPATLPRTDNIAFDWRVFLAGCGLTLLTAVLFGLIPSLRASRVDLESALRESTRGSSAGVGRNRGYHALIAAQVAMAVVVLIAAGLLTKSFGALLRNDLGMSPEGVLTFEVSLPDAGYPEGADRARFHRELHRRVEALPGVTAAGAVSWLPSSGRYNIWGYEVDGENDPEDVDVRVVQGSYFGALDIGLVDGRYFDFSDRADSAKVAIVSESLARRHWVDTSALGETIAIGGVKRTIVGVVRDTRYDHRAGSAPMTYLPHEQFADIRNWALIQVLEADGDPAALRRAVEREIASMDHALVMHHVRRLEEVVADAIARDRFAMLLMAAFGWTALLLAVVGIYGLLSYLVAQRTREIGSRIALGAQRREILSSVVGRALRVAAAGTLAGCLAAALGTRWMESMLYGVAPTDGAVFLTVILVANAAVMLACLGPASKAVSVSPTTALRQE